MKSIILFVGLIGFSPSLFGMCYERFYTQEHLSKHPDQEVRSVIVQNEDWASFISDEAPIKVQIHLVQNGKDKLAEVTGRCQYDNPEDPWAAQREDRAATGTCNFNSQGPRSATFRAKLESSLFGYEPGEILFKVAPNFVYDDVTAGSEPGSKIKITDYDKTFLVHFNAMESNLGRTCEKTLLMAHQKNLPRYWNEAILHSIRNDLARPTVTARNLFHLSALLWDIYALYNSENTYYLSEDSDLPASSDKTASMNKVMSFAAHKFLRTRYELAPGNGDNYPNWELGTDGEPDNRVNLFLDRALKRLGYFLEDQGVEAQLGRQLAEELIQSQLNDGSREANNYSDPDYQNMVNNQIADISQSGLKRPHDYGEGGDIFSFMPKYLFDHFGFSIEDQSLVDSDVKSGPSIAEEVDIDHWIRLHIPGSIDQSGNAQASEQQPLTLFWGELPTFGNLEEYRSEDKAGVYFDPSQYYPSFRDSPEKVILANLQVVGFSALLNPQDMSNFDFDRDGKPDDNPGAEMIDISPSGLGNNSLGTNDGAGRSINPITGQSYQPYKVKAANYYRSIAEFWADGPSSETPPGHWNTLANYVMDQLQKNQVGFNWLGDKQKQLTRKEYELRLYLTLNGALHDAAVVAWGIKGHFQGNRPITVIRKLAHMAEKDPAFGEYLESLAPDLVKMVTYKKEVLNSTGQIETKEVTRLAIKAWRGPREHGFYLGDFDGGGYVEMRDFSFKKRDSLALEENDFFSRMNHAGVGWILAENWLPYQRQTFVTPPFPGCVSGHSTFSRAAAEILTGVTGSEYFPGGLGTYPAPPLHFEYDETKDFEFQWATYFDASDTSGISRLYGGIHASYDDLPAREIGSKVGKKALEKAKNFFR